MAFLRKIKKNWKKAGKYTKAAIIVIIIGALLRLVLASVMHISGDACWHISAARFIADNFKMPLFEPIGREVFWAPPLFHIVAAILYKIFGVFGNSVAEFSVRLISPIAGSLMLVYMFLITKKLFNEKIGFYSTLFLAFIPIHIYLSSIPFVDAMLSLFILISIYYILDNRAAASGIFAGLALLTKYNGIFVVPVIILIMLIKNYKNKKLLAKNLVVFVLVSGLIGSAWHIRNWVLLGSPVWPFYTNLFADKTGLGEVIVGEGYPFRIGNLLNPKHIVSFYIETFGVPAGNIRNLFFLDIPMIKLLLLVWGAATFLFIIPFFIGLLNSTMKKAENRILVAWLASFLIMAIAWTAKSNIPLTRYFIPAFPVIAIFWGIGLSNILKARKIRGVVLLILFLCILGFVFTESVKAAVVKNSWGYYDDDFRWVRENTEKDSIFLVTHDNCFAYNFDRLTEMYYSAYHINDTEKITRHNISYIWVNQRFNLTGTISGKALVYPDEFIGIIEKYPLAYNNEKTGTRIYKVG